MSIEGFDKKPQSAFLNVPEQPQSLDKTIRTSLGTSEAFRDYLHFSKMHSDEFWEQIASEFEWIRRWDSVQKGTLPKFEFFSGGIMNPCANLLDRHVAKGAGNRVALIWEGETGESAFLTYQMLLDEVQRFSNVLKGIGIRRGDPVAIFLPNVIECVVAILALFPHRRGLQHDFLGFLSACPTRSPRSIFAEGSDYRRSLHSPWQTYPAQGQSGRMYRKARR
jgi:hypothetical protein